MHHSVLSIANWDEKWVIHDAIIQIPFIFSSSMDCDVTCILDLSGVINSLIWLTINSVKFDYLLWSYVILPIKLVFIILRCK